MSLQASVQGSEAVDVEAGDSASPALQRSGVLGFPGPDEEKDRGTVPRRDISQYLQEPIVSIRDGRYVLPVRQNTRPRSAGCPRPVGFRPDPLRGATGTPRDGQPDEAFGTRGTG